MTVTVTETETALPAPRPQLVSVVIPNYNYARFLGEAVDSALALDWPKVEVIVVDDGSTDDSRGVIERYGDRIASIFQVNGGQTAACNAGFARSRGDLVIFLDADDLLAPSVIREVAAVWRPGISKVQFQMRVIDGEGNPTGALLPQYRLVPNSAQIRRWVMTAGAYPTPPGSGNVYAREFLRQIFPLDGTEPASDSYVLAAAPYLGDVVTVPKPLMSYRVHGSNDGAMATMDVTRFGRELARAQWRFKYSQGIARSVGLTLPDHIFDRSMSVLPYRLASLRLARALHPLPHDSVESTLLHVMRAFFVEQGITAPARIALLLWSISVAIAPLPLCERLVLLRFASSSRPKRLARLLKMLKILGR